MFNEPPDLLVVDNRLKDISGREVANLVKSENVYRQLPVVMCVDPIDVEEPWNWNKVEVDDFFGTSLQSVRGTGSNQSDSMQGYACVGC